MQSGVLGEGCNRRSQHPFRIAISSKLPVEISQVDRPRRVSRTETKAGFVLNLGLARESTPNVKIAQRGTRLGSIRIIPLCGHILRRGARIGLAVIGGLIWG